MGSKVSPRLSENAAAELCEHVYGPRLARDFPACFTHLCDINQAHLLMLQAQRLLPPDNAALLAAALRQIEQEGADAVPLDPALEDAYLNYEAHLMRAAGAHVGGCLHVARSRNDILATMDRLRARHFVVELVERLCVARATALEQAGRYAEVVMPGYTHMQPGQPITFGFYFLGVADMLGRDIVRMTQVEPQLDLCPLGAGALAGTSFQIDREHSAASLGFKGVVPHALDAVASRDYGLEFLSSLAIMATGASRVAQDFYVWCTPEFNLVRFPDSVAGTSSIMPQKKNHVALEYLKGKAGQISGALMAAITTVKGTNFTHTGDGNRESMRNLWDAAEEALRIAGMLDLVLRSAQPNESRMLQRATDDFSSATDLADTLVRVCGLSFREAHHVVGAVVRAALNDGLNASQVTSAMVDQAARDQLGKPLLLAQSVVQASLDPRVSVQARSVIGGPNAEGVRARCAAMSAEAASQRAANLERKHGFAAARAELKRRISALAGPAQVCAVE